MYFLCFLSLASSRSSPERNQVSCCTSKETVSPNLARRAFRPRHLQPWVFYCVSWRDSTKQNPRRLLNAEKWLKIEHNNYHREQPSTWVGAAPAPQLPRWKEDAGQHREGPPPQREAWDLGSWLILTDEPGPCYPVKVHLEGICTPGWFQGNHDPPPHHHHRGLPCSLHSFISLFIFWWQNTHNLKPPFCFLSMDMTSPGTSCNRDHTVFLLLGLAYFTQHNVLEVHPHYRRCANFLHF